VPPEVIQNDPGDHVSAVRAVEATNTAQGRCDHRLDSLTAISPSLVGAER
jgi:hypothetical protein